MSDAQEKFDLLVGPLAKVEWAKRHINNLNERVIAYLASAPFELRIRQSDNPPERLVYVEARTAIPNEFSLILGDAVHNLRTALDHVCFGMVGSTAPRRRSVGFPFVDKADSLDSAIATRQLNVAPNAVIEAIRALEPYPNGNRYLHAVKSLDERDKHHFVVTVGLGIKMTVANLQEYLGPGVIECDDPHNTLVETVGDFVAKLEPDETIEKFDQRADTQPSFTIGFGYEEALPNQAIIPALKTMALQTEKAVKQLAAAYCK